MKTVLAADLGRLPGVPDHAETSSDARRTDEEERVEESYEATILRLDGLTLERLLHQVGE